jgi:putrescine transport system substrate-binding protein
MKSVGKKLCWQYLIAIAIAAVPLQTMAQSNEKIVNVFNWADYIGTDTVKNFEKEYGIKVNYDEYESSEMVEAKLLSGRTGYDVVVHSSMYSKRLFPLNIFQKLDKTKLTNWKLLDPKLMAILATFDPGNNFMAPYSWGSTGIAYNVDMILERMPDAPLDSGAMLFDPEVVSKFEDCGVSLLDSPTDVIPIALVYLGYADNTRNPEAIQAAEDLLLSVRPYIRKFTSTTFLNDLPNGDLCVSMSWAGDYATASARAEEVGSDINLAYFVPKEGSLLWVDTIIIPDDAPHTENAYLFLDYLYRPEVMADFVNLTHYASPIPAANAFIDEKVLNDPAIYPTPEIMERLFLTEVDSPKYQRQKTRVFTRAKSGLTY